MLKKEEKKNNNFRSLELDGTHMQNAHHTHVSLFFKARLELIERQACFFSPSSSSIKKTSEETDIQIYTQTLNRPVTKHVRKLM